METEFPVYKKHPLNKFLNEYPLNKPFLAVENYVRQCRAYTDPYEIKGTTFMHHCVEENELKTFELVLTLPNQKYYGELPGDRIPAILFNPDGRLDFTHHFIGMCRSCNNYKIHYLLHVWTDKPIPEDQSERVVFVDGLGMVPADSREHDRANLYIEKLGGPKVKVEIPRYIEKYLGRESANWYYKAQYALQENLGIGAFAYFRRIIEKELLRFVEDIIALPSVDPELKAVVIKHQASSKPHLIYEEIYELLPNSLRALDANPLKLLYQQTSEGLHSLTEAACLERAKSIDVLLNFVMVRINEEKSLMLEARNAIKQLRALK